MLAQYVEIVAKEQLPQTSLPRSQNQLYLSDLLEEWVNGSGHNRASFVYCYPLVTRMEAATVLRPNCGHWHEISPNPKAAMGAGWSRMYAN